MVTGMRKPAPPLRPGMQRARQVPVARVSSARYVTSSTWTRVTGTWSLGPRTSMSPSMVGPGDQVAGCVCCSVVPHAHHDHDGVAVHRIGR